MNSASGWFDPLGCGGEIHTTVCPHLTTFLPSENVTHVNASHEDSVAPATASATVQMSAEALISMPISESAKNEV